MAYLRRSPMPVVEGGTGAQTLAAHSVLLGESTSAINPMAAGTTGQTIMGVTGADPRWTGSPSFSGTVTAATGLFNTDGTSTINTGVSTLSLSVDAAATTVNIATGAGAKVVQVGSTNGASSLALKYGTADFTLASAAGTVMSALDTGEVTFPLQSSFSAYLSTATSNVTGNGTVYQLICNVENFDRNSDYNNATGVFTAPVTGIYALYAQFSVDGLQVANTGGYIYFTTTPITIYQANISFGAIRTVGNAYLWNGSLICALTAGDTATISVRIDSGTKTVGLTNNASYTIFSGMLVC